MAFVKASASMFEPPPHQQPGTDIVAAPAACDLWTALESPDAATRRHAARDLAADPAAAAALAARLAVEGEPSVREALFGSLVDIGGAGVAALVAPLIRCRDAGLRNAALEALKQLEDAAEAAVDTLLADADPDVRLLAVEVTRAWSSARAGPRLLRIIAADPHVNVCGAAVDVATESGSGDLLPALEALRERFPGDEFLGFAIDVACARLQHGGTQDRRRPAGSGGADHSRSAS
jgi:hypothetical protein